MQSNITTEPIRTTNELEFAFFCIESIAEKVHKDTYIVPLYDILHTQSKQYIVDDILTVMKDRGIAV